MQDPGDRGTKLLDSGSHFYEVYETACGIRGTGALSVELYFHAGIIPGELDGCIIKAWRSEGTHRPGEAERFLGETNHPSAELSSAR